MKDYFLQQVVGVRSTFGIRIAVKDGATTVNALQYSELITGSNDKQKIQRQISCALFFFLIRITLLLKLIDHLLNINLSLAKSIIRIQRIIIFHGSISLDFWPNRVLQNQQYRLRVRSRSNHQIPQSNAIVEKKEAMIVKSIYHSPTQIRFSILCCF